MNSIQVRIPSHLFDRLNAEIHRRSATEPVAFGLASHAKVGGKDLILLREVIIPPKSAFLPANGHGARWRGAYTVELLNQALERDLGLFIFHAHPGSAAVSMSSDDLSSAFELLPRFQHIQPNRPHGSIVFGVDSVAGAILMPDVDKVIQQFSLRAMGKSGLRTWPLPLATPAEYLLLRRQPFTENLLLRRIFGELTIAVVGLSGGGSQVVPHLAALGFREIIAVDDQRCDSGNRMASPNVGRIDAMLGLRKTTSARFRTWLTNPRVKFTPINAKVPTRHALKAIKRADIIIGCVNNLHARADLNEIAWRYCIPYVDVGLAMVADKESPLEPRPLEAVPGNIFSAIPGGPCLWCSEFLTEAKLSAETGGRGRPYLHGSNGADVFVSSFNGTLASEAVSEILRLVAVVGGDREARLQYDGFAGAVTPVVVHKWAACPLCVEQLAAGDPIWHRF